MDLLCPASTLSSPEEMLPLPVLPESVTQGPSFPYLSHSASEGLGAGLPLLPLVAAPPGDGVKAAGLTK